MKTPPKNTHPSEPSDIARPNLPILQEARPNSTTGTGRPKMATRSERSKMASRSERPFSPTTAMEAKNGRDIRNQRPKLTHLENEQNQPPQLAKKKFYPGNKGADGTYQRIINQMPPHSVYIELFAGSGQILIKKNPAARNIAIDRSTATISAHSCSWPIGTEVICTDSIQWLRDNLAQFGPETLIYADPPYPRESRKSPKKLYEFEMDQDQHIQLLELLKQSKTMVILSSYPNALYSQQLEATHRMEQFTVSTRGGTALEILWMNYPTPTALHQYDMLGTDKEERRRIKRKTTRWKNRLNHLPPLERNAIIHAIQTQPKS